MSKSVAIPPYPTVWAGGGSGPHVEKKDYDTLREIATAAILNAQPVNPCSCVADGDNGAIAHICNWHESALREARIEGAKWLADKLVSIGFYTNSATDRDTIQRLIDEESK